MAEYHELREVLRTPTHPNVTAQHEYLVTRETRNRDQPVVCVLIVQYHSGGSFLDRLKYDSSCRGLQLHQDTKTKWIRQLAKALRHTRNVGRSFYSDLRLDNIVLTDRDGIVLVNFEQCGSARLQNSKTYI